MSKPRAQVSREAELELLRTLDKARAAAKTLYATEVSTVDFGNRTKDIHFAPLEDVQAEVARLSSVFGLLLWTDNIVVMRSPDGLTLSARFTLYDLASGASKVFEFEGLCFPLSEHNGNAAWAGEASVSYAWRNAALRIFGIPVMRRTKVDHQSNFTPAVVAVAGLVAAKMAHPVQQSAPLTVSSLRPYTADRYLEELRVWSARQRDMEIASSGESKLPELATCEAWSACRTCAKTAGVIIRPLVPGDKPVTETEYEELYNFLYAENLVDGTFR